MTKRKSWRSQQCRWTANDDGVYSTSCDHLFEFTNDGPLENGFKFCPYCGGHMHADIVLSQSMMRAVAPAASQDTK